MLLSTLKILQNSRLVQLGIYYLHFKQLDCVFEERLLIAFFSLSYFKVEYCDCFCLSGLYSLLHTFEEVCTGGKIS